MPYMMHIIGKYCIKIVSKVAKLVAYTCPTYTCTIHTHRHRHRHNVHTMMCSRENKNENCSKCEKDNVKERQPIKPHTAFTIVTYRFCYPSRLKCCQMKIHQIYQNLLQHSIDLVRIRLFDVRIRHTLHIVDLKLHLNFHLFFCCLVNMNVVRYFEE